jgi:hypothetical protein
MKDAAAALRFMAQLLYSGIAFSVEPKTDRVNVTTPFELSPLDFPHEEGLL